MIPRTAVHSKRWLASAAAGLMLAGSTASAQPQAVQPPGTAVASGEPRTITPAPGRPVQFAAAKPAARKGGLLSVLFGDQQPRTAARPGMAAHTAPPASHPATGPHNVMPPVYSAVPSGTNHKTVPAAHESEVAARDPIAPPRTFVPQAPAVRQKRPGFLARMFGSKPAPAHRANTPAGMPASEPALAQSRYPATRRLDGAGVVSSTLAPNQIDEATTSLLPAPEPAPGAEAREMFVRVPPMAAPAGSLPSNIQPAELPAVAQHESALLPIPEAAADSSAPADEPAAVAATDSKFELPTITPAADSPGAAEPARQASHQAGHEDKYAQIASRSGAGFKGFCPVVLRDERELADADPAFSTTFESQTFSFSSAEAQAKFEAEPGKYVPVQAGRDLVSAAEGQETAGSIDHAVWFRNRLYLFSSHQTLRKFVTEPARFTRDE